MADRERTTMAGPPPVLDVTTTRLQQQEREIRKLTKELTREQERHERTRTEFGALKRDNAALEVIYGNLYQKTRGLLAIAAEGGMKLTILQLVQDLMKRHTDLFYKILKRYGIKLDEKDPATQEFRKLSDAAWESVYQMRLGIFEDPSSGEPKKVDDDEDSPRTLQGIIPVPVNAMLPEEAEVLMEELTEDMTEKEMVEFPSRTPFLPEVPGPPVPPPPSSRPGRGRLGNTASYSADFIAKGRAIAKQRIDEQKKK